MCFARKHSVERKERDVTLGGLDEWRGMEGDVLVFAKENVDGKDEAM